MKKNTTLLFSLFAAISAGAQTEDSTSIGTQDLQPVEVRSLRASSNSPFAKTEVSAKDIKKLNQGQDIPYLLQYTPSAVTTSDAGTGIGYTGLRVRGTDGSRINVTLNGVPVNDAESQGAYFVDFPDVASSTSSIQVQRGVGTSTNGTGSFGAAISVNNMAQMETAGAEAYIGAGSFNTHRYTVKAGTGLLSNGFQLDVRLSQITSDGYIDRSASDLKSMQILAGWKMNEKTSFRFMMMTGIEKTGQAWNGVPQDSLSTNRTYNELGVKADGSYYDNQTDNYRQDYYQFFADHKFNSHLTAHAGLFLTVGKGYYEEYRLGQSFSTYGMDDFTSGTDTLTSTDLIRQLYLDNKYFGAVYSLMYTNNNTSLTFGGNVSRYDGEHYGYVKWAEYGFPADYKWYHLDARKDQINFYLKAQQTVAEKLILFGDAQFRRVHYDINGFRDNRDLHPVNTYNFFNPKVGATYLLKNTAIDHQKVYISGAIANKEPNRGDFEAGVSTTPKAEKLIDLEAGYELNRRKWSVGLNLYHMDYKDQLILTGQINDVGAYTRTNVPKSYRQGIELQATWQALYWLRLSGNTTLSRNKVDNFTEYIDNYDTYVQQENAYTATDIAFSPSVIGTGIVSLAPFRNLPANQQVSLDIYNKYVGKQYLDNTSNEDRSIDAYTVCDVRLNYGVKVAPFKELNFTVAINNAFDKKYVSNGYTFSYIYGGDFSTFNYYYPQAGRNLLVGLNVKF